MHSATSPASSSMTQVPIGPSKPFWAALTGITTKAPWSEPEKSIGSELSPFDKSHQCWETAGPVLDFAPRLLAEVARLLDARHAYLNDGEPVDFYVSFGLYMIGRRKEKSNLTLLFVCLRPSPRKRAVELVKESRILDRYSPGIRLGDSIRIPYRIQDPSSTSLRPFRLLVGEEVQQPSLVETSELSRIYCMPRVDRACGVPIIISNFNKNLRKATLGGLVVIGGTHFGLTVSHAFLGHALEFDGENNKEMLTSAADLTATARAIWR